MSHLVETMAYTNEQPWHRLGANLPANQALEVWAEKAGMAWDIKEAPVRYLAESKDSLGLLSTFPDQKVLYRSDTRSPLSVVSSRYQVVQLRDVLEFYRDLTKMSGFELETAGVLKGGKKFWAMARTGKSVALRGNDVVNGYLLLATSCDGSLATSATFTSVRVVCNNTLKMALDNADGVVKVPHSTTFNPMSVKMQLSLAVAVWDPFMYRMKALSERKVKTPEYMSFLMKVFGETELNPSGLSNERAMKKVQALYEGMGKGSNMVSSKGTAWGLLNAVTEFVDHERKAKSLDYRLDSAWFGNGAALKQKALATALQMVE